MTRRVVLPILAILFAGFIVFSADVRRVEASGTIYIRADGSIDPPTAQVSTVDNATYTFTGNIFYESVVVLRNNVVFDGAGYTLQGSMSGTGIELLANNVTIENMNIKDFSYSIQLDSCSNNRVCESNITNNGGGISVLLLSSSNSTISGNNITTDGGLGIELDSSSNNTVSQNDITNTWVGIAWEPWIGVWLISSSYNTISENNITGETWGVSLAKFSSYNRVSGNNITDNVIGIVLGYWISHIDLGGCSNNAIYHNNFIDIYEQDVSGSSTSAWDDGYPSGGNYWNDYNGTDAKSGSYQNATGSDGIGDTPYVIDANNTDNYPLMGMFSEFNVTYFTPPLVAHTCNVTVISNSSVSDFVAPVWIEHPEVIFLEFNVTGAEGSAGFCRVSFPTAMMNGTYHVFVSGIEVPFVLLPCSNADYSFLHFTYLHSTKEVAIIPEFPTFFILPLFMTATLLVVSVFRRRRIDTT